MKKLFSLLALFLAFGLTSARAELAEVQVGSIGNTFSNNYPLYTMSANSECFTLYKQNQLTNIEAGTTIKEITYFGYKTSNYSGVFTVKAYLANTTQDTFNDASPWLTTAPNGTGTVIDESKMTKFAEYTWECTTTFGSQNQPVEVFTLQSDNGFTYEGGNLLIFLSMEKVSGSNGNYTNFALASQADYKCVGAYRENNYTIGTAGWSYASSGWNIPNIPVVKFGLQTGGETIITDHYVGATDPTKTVNVSPLNAQDAQSQSITIYGKDLLGSLESGAKLKQLKVQGYSTRELSATYTYTLYLANTDVMDPNTFLTSTASTAPVDLDKFTQVATYVWTAPTPTGSANDFVDIITFDFDNEFTYTGNNLAVYINLNSSGSSYNTINMLKATNATQQNAKCIFRGGSFGYDSQSWSSTHGGDGISGRGIGAMILGESIDGGGGTIPTISATVTGRVVASTSSMSYISGATVTITETPVEGDATEYTTETASNGTFSVTVDPVDTKATYTLKVEKEGYDPYNYTGNLDLKGGNVTISDIPLVKSPVPATVTGKVLDKVSNVAIAGATVSFNGQTVTSGADGTYSFAIANIDALTQENMTISATAKGYIPYSMGLNNLQGGTNNFNISMSPVPEIPGTGTLIGTWDDIDGYSYFAPIYQLSVYTGSQMIYPASLFKGVEVGDRFSSLSFFGYYTMGSGAPDIDDGDDDGYGDYNDPWMSQRRAEEPLKREFDVTVYMVGTDQTTLTADTPIDFGNLTPVYEGMVEMPMLGAKNDPAQLITIDLDTPFVFEGKNVAIIIMANRTAKPEDQGTIPYFCIDTSFENNVIYKEAGQPESFAIAEWRVPSRVGNPVGLPIMRLGGFVPTATVSGIVSDKATNVALEGVEVTLSAEGIASINTLTDARGAYSLSLRDVDYDATYTLSFSYGDYYDESVDVTFTNETLEQTINMQMEKPAEAVNGTITGKVMKAHKDEPLSDVTVTLSMTPAQGATVGNIAMATTDINGNYTINVVDIDLTATYSLAFTREGYNETSATVPFTADNLDVTVNVELVKDPESGIAGISADFNGDIFTVMGICVKRNANINDVYALPQGIYIIDGKKVIIR